MKFINIFCLLCAFFNLSACSINTKFDDDEYRPVGASSPVNSVTHTVSETQITEIETTSNNEASGSTRYTHPGQDNDSGHIVHNTKSMASKSDKNMTVSGTNSQIEKNQPAGNDNIISKTINNIFSSRYGDPGTIIKISKTVQIHCKQSHLKTSAASDIVICEYRFPEYCGAHAFSLLSSHNKQLLMFHDNKLQRNIIDTLRADKQSSPGLWDKDDFVSSKLLSVKQLISNKTIDSNNLGWIMNVSEAEKAQLAQAYITAINDTSKCF